MRAVVVEYHSGDSLARCLRSLEENGVDEIVVVDNGDDPSSRDRVRSGSPRAVIRQPGSNLGFGGGVNLGAAGNECELLLVCNPDVELHFGALDTLRARLASLPTAGVVGPALLDRAGRVTQSARAFPTFKGSWQQAFLGLLRPAGRRSRRYRARNWELAEQGSVGWVTGACFLVRSRAFDELGGFDEGYFLYVEEVDFCWRAHRAGWDVVYEPSAKVSHVGGVSTSPHPYRAIVTHHRSLGRFVWRTSSGRQRLAFPLVVLALAVRCVTACLLHRRRKETATSTGAAESQ